MSLTRPQRGLKLVLHGNTHISLIHIVHSLWVIFVEALIGIPFLVCGRLLSKQCGKIKQIQWNTILRQEYPQELWTKNTMSQRGVEWVVVWGGLAGLTFLYYRRVKWVICVVTHTQTIYWSKTKNINVQNNLHTSEFVKSRTISLREMLF